MGYALVPLLDLACYHNNQNFRSWGSSKFGVAGVPLQLYQAGSTVFDHGVPPEPTIEYFRQSLLTIRTAFDQDVIIVQNDKDTENPSEQLQDLSGDGQEPPRPPPFPEDNTPQTNSDSDGEPSRILINNDLRDRILRCLQTNFGYNKKVKWAYYRKFAVIIPTDMKHCLIANRAHSTNCVYFVYMDETFALYQKCHANKYFGIDDATAILALLVSPHVDVRALTVVDGNVSVEQGIADAKILLRLTSRQDVEIYRGAAVPIVPGVQKKECWPGHGADGLGGFTKKEGWKEFEERHLEQEKPDLVKGEHAALAMIRMVTEKPDYYTILAIGPLTNLAL
ncbi:hypothetical protein HDU96_003396, partial [Phlyctochytrium bullatum]